MKKGELSRRETEEFCDYVKLNLERSFITTDLGQIGMPHPIDGMKVFIRTAFIRTTRI